MSSCCSNCYCNKEEDMRTCHTIDAASVQYSPLSSMSHVVYKLYFSCCYRHSYQDAQISELEPMTAAIPVIMLTTTMTRITTIITTMIKTLARTMTIPITITTVKTNNNNINNNNNTNDNNNENNNVITAITT